MKGLPGSGQDPQRIGGFVLNPISTGIAGELAKDIDGTFQILECLGRRRTPCEGKRKKEEKEKGPADKHQLPTLLRVKGIKEIAYASGPSGLTVVRQPPRCCARRCIPRCTARGYRAPGG